MRGDSEDELNSGDNNETDTGYLLFLAYLPYFEKIGL
jgi:hypothetical protein